MTRSSCNTTNKSTLLEMEGLRPNDSSPRYHALDGVRGLAVLLVLIWHYIPCILSDDALAWAPIVRRLFSTTGYGVDLFFVLSGFLIGGIQLDHRINPHFIRAFYIRRCCRIFPLYVILLGTFVIVSRYEFMGENAHEWLFGGNIPFGSYLSFTQNIFMGLHDAFGGSWLAVTWSLAVEEQFYLIIPFVVLLCNGHRFEWCMLGLLILLPVLRLLSPGFHSSVNMPWRGDGLVAGCLAAWIIRDKGFPRWAANHGRIIVLFTIIAGALALSQIAIPKSLGVLGLSVHVAFFLGIVMIARLELVPVVSNFFLTRPLRLMGNWCYGIYLFHQPVSGLLHGTLKDQAPIIRGWEDAIITVVAALLTLVLSALAFRYIEFPLLNFGKKFRYNTESKKAFDKSECRP